MICSHIRLAQVSGCHFALRLDFLASLLFILGLSPLSPRQGWVCLLVSAGLLSTLFFLETAEFLSSDDFSFLLFPSVAHGLIPCVLKSAVVSISFVSLIYRCPGET